MLEKLKMDCGMTLNRVWFYGAHRLSELKKRVLGGLSGTYGQGTVEYAILVGVLVVVGMLAVAAFKGKVTSLWDEITSGFNGL